MSSFDLIVLNTVVNLANFLSTIRYVSWIVLFIEPVLHDLAMILASQQVEKNGVSAVLCRVKLLHEFFKLNST